MKIYVSAWEYPKGRLISPPIDEMDFAERLLRQRDALRKQLLGEVALGVRSQAFRSLRIEAVDVRALPREAGWTLVFQANDPDREEICRLLRPLIEHRGAAERKPLLVDPANDWSDWLDGQFSVFKGDKRPEYFLLIGDPTKLPFQFQAFLDQSSSVGRLAFNRLEDYRNYAEKVVRLETNKTVKRDVMFFASDLGPDDPTYYSRRWMVDPLAADAQKRLGFSVLAKAGPGATRKGMIAAMEEQTPALVYTATHGFAAGPAESDGTRRRVNGAIVCQPSGKEASADEYLFGAGELAGVQRCFEGAVFFQFACFGYGTPADSEFSRWLPEVSSRNAQTDFVAALPEALLAHPRGPVAFIGHLDVAVLHGFTDEEEPELEGAWDARLNPFASAVQEVLSSRPVGLAMHDLNVRAGGLAVTLNLALDGKQKDTPQFRKKIARDFIRHADAKNFMVMGDPAARANLDS